MQARIAVHQLMNPIMPGAGPARPRAAGSGARPGRTRRACLVTVALAVAGALVAGCGAAAAQPGGPALSLLSAQVTVPNSDGVTDAYLVLQNKGPAVRLVGARTSAGGTVALRSPADTGRTVMRTVPAIVVPAHSLFRLDPDGSHLLITRSGRMKAGTEITITLIFSRGQHLTGSAMVTDPATGGASYFLN